MPEPDDLERPRVRYCTTEHGVQIAYKVEGEGPPLLIVPALWESFSMEDEFVPELAGFYRALGEGRTLIRYDARGSGLSQRDVTDHSYDGLALDLVAVVNATGLAPVSIWAVLHGGVAAMPFAARHPDLVARLMMSGTYAQRGQWRTYADFCRDHWDEASQTIVDGWARRAQPELGVRAAEGLRRSITGESMARRIEQNNGIDLRPLLHQIACPTLVIGGVNDPDNKEVVDAIPGARFAPVFIPDGFYFAEGSNKPFLQAATSFLDEDPRTRRLPPKPAPREQSATVAPEPVAPPPEPVDLDRPRVRYARTKDGVNIAYCAIGSGKPLIQMSALPFRHFVFNWDYYKAIASVVTQRGRMFVTFDARGLGSSSAADDLSLDAYVSDLEAVVDALGADEIDLAAVTYSCPIAITYAAKHPERVGKMALEMPFVRGKEALDTEVGRAVRALRGQNWELYSETSMYAIFSWNKEVAHRQAALLRAAATPGMAQRTYDAVDAFDVSGLMGAVRCPTLVTFRTNVSLLPIDEARAVAAGIPSAQFAVAKDDEQWILETGTFLGILEPAEPLPVQSASGREATVAHARAAHGTAIILFADIVDSTALTERLGDASFREQARVLDATLRRVIESAGGTPIAGRTLGDGVLATFPAARQAIEAALRCATAGDDAGLPLHLGLHAGDVIREGTDIYGGAVNIAARISGLTGPSEVLVSDIVRGLGRTSADVVFEDRGEHALKGVSDAVRVYQVRSKSAARSTLPDGLTALEAEVLRLIAAGRTNTEIASELALSVRTVARHITNIYTKIAARNKAEATDYAHRNRLT